MAIAFASNAHRGNARAWLEPPVFGIFSSLAGYRIPTFMTRAGEQGLPQTIDESLDHHMFERFKGYVACFLQERVLS